MNIENQDLFNTFAAVISSHIVEQPSSCYYLHDNEIDFTILKHSIIDKDKTCCTLFVLQEPVCCVVINTSFRITILQVVEIIKHLSMCILILQHEKRKKSPAASF